MVEEIYNPHKGRRETIRVEYNEENTSWFNDCSKPEDIYRLTDMESGLLIKENNCNCPALIYDVARAAINCNPLEAKRIRDMYVE